LGHFYFLN